MADPGLQFAGCAAEQIPLRRGLLQSDPLHALQIVQDVRIHRHNVGYHAGWDIVPPGIPCLAGIPCRRGYRAINWRGYRAVPRNDAARSGPRSVCFVRGDDACARMFGWRPARRSMVRVSRPSSTSPGGNVQCGRYWTRRGAPGICVQLDARHTRRFRFARVHHKSLALPVPVPSLHSSSPPGPAGKWPLPQAGRRRPGWACEWRNRRCLPGPAPSRATPGTCTRWQRSHPVRALPAARGRQHSHARTGPVGS